VWCIPESGPWHDLIAGTTRAGKSRLLDQLLTTSRQAKGYMVDWVIDPQNGQSLPDWVDEVDWFAAGVDEGMKVLRAARALMYARNLVFAGREHTDRRGRTKKGMKGFTPTLEYPQLNLTIDEAHAMLQIPEAVTILAEMGKMGSKCGIKVRLVVHLPLLSELGGSSVLRDMVASGNVFVLRTASRITGQVAFQGALPVDPVMIPRRMPDGSSLRWPRVRPRRRLSAAPRCAWTGWRTPSTSSKASRSGTCPITRLQAPGSDYAQYRGLRFDEDIIDVEVVEDAPVEPQEPVRGPRARRRDLRGPPHPDGQGVREPRPVPRGPRVARRNRPQAPRNMEEPAHHQDHQGRLRRPQPAGVVRRRPIHLLLQGGVVTDSVSSPTLKARLFPIAKTASLIAALALVAQSEWALAIAVGWPAWIAWAAPLALDAYVLAAISANRDLGPSVVVSSASVLGSHAVYAAPGAWDGGVVNQGNHLVWQLAAACSVVPLLVTWRVHHLHLPAPVLLEEAPAVVDTDRHCRHTACEHPCEHPCGTRATPRGPPPRPQLVPPLVALASDQAILDALTEPLGQSELARRSGVAPSTLKNAVKRLETAGHVEKVGTQYRRRVVA
jgi:hypothetical protein